MKKLLFFAVVAAMFICLAACDKPEDKDPDPTTTVGNTTTLATHEHIYHLGDFKEATCAEAGYANYVCDCGDSYKEETDALGHAYDSYVSMDPQCNAQGEKTFICSVCAHSYTEAIATTDHTWDNWFVSVAPTFTTKGLEKRFCTVCRAEQTSELDTISLEEELGQIAKLAVLLPRFYNVKDVPITDLFSCVRIEAGYETLSFDEETYEITMIYSLKAFDAFTMRYLDCTFDWASLSAVDPNVSIDTENNKLAYVTYGAGGWGETAMESFTKVDDTHYSIRYYYHDYDNVPLYYGILNVKLTDKGFVIEAHLDAE